MFQDYFAQSDHLIWPLIGLVIFVLLFVGVLAYVFLGLRDKEKVDEIAALPLAEDSATDNRMDVSSQADGRAHP
jgi:cbb3-type cytochrome oxidase subunit 3